MRIATLIVMLCLPFTNTFAQVFVKLPNSQGVVHSYYGMNGAGGSFYDWDKDGLPDITLCRNGLAPLFYHNEGGTFSQVPTFFSNSGDIKTIQWVDFDNDGDPDLSVSRLQSPFVIYVNDGNMNFTPIGPEMGLPSESWLTYGHSWGDYDRDGDLDLYICNYDPVPPVTNHLLRNNGDGSFTDVTMEAGVSDGHRYSFQAVWCDFNFDGWQDLYVINDKTSPNSFYLNNGDGTFADYGTITGSDVIIEAMTNSVADYDNDGDFDIYITNTGADNVLLRAVEPLLFEDATQEAGLELNIMSWGALFFDYDNNGLQDIFITTEIQPNKLFTHNSDHTFSSVLIPMTESGNYSFSPLEGDINNDGLSDLVIVSGAGTNTTIWRNETADPGHYLKVDLRGTVSNRDAIGTIIEVHSQDQSWRKVHTSSINYLGQNSQYLNFGLGSSELVDSLIIRWPSGFIEAHYNLGVDQFIQFTEGETLTADVMDTGSLSYCDGDTTHLIITGEWDVVNWNLASDQDTLTVTTSGTFWAQCIHMFGFEIWTDTLSINFNPVPNATAIVENVLCFGDNNGSISLTVDSVAEPMEFFWTNGDTIPLISGLTSGLYACTIIDANGCYSDFQSEITEPEPLTLTSTCSESSLFDDGWISWEHWGGTEPIQVELNGELIEETPVNGLVAGDYHLVITDANSCSTDTTLTILQGVGVEENAPSEWLLWPNPSSGIIHLPAYPNNSGIEIHDLHGKIALGWNFIGERVLDISQMASGVYILSVNSGNPIQSRHWRFCKTE